MRTRILFTALSMGAGAVLCCKGATEPPNTQVSTDAVKACANLRTIGCAQDAPPDAGADSCDVALTRRNDLKPLPLQCWAEAPTPAVAQLCAGAPLRCPAPDAGADASP